MLPGAIATGIARIPAPLSAKLQGAFLVMLVALLATGLVSLSALGRIRGEVADLQGLDQTVALTRTLDYSLVAQEHLSSMFVLTGEGAYHQKIVEERERFETAAAELRTKKDVDSRLIDAVDSAFARYVEAADDVVAARRQGRERDAVDGHVTREHVIAHEIESVMRALVENVDNERRRSFDHIVGSQRAVTLVAPALFVGALGMALVLAVVLARSIVQPIREVDEALEGIARGEFVTIPTVVNRDEVGSLVANVNRTSAQLADLYAKEREARAALEAQIAEGQRTQAQLIQSEKLRALGEMSGGVAHDFNNLLAGVLGQAELLLYELETGVHTPATMDRRLRLIQQAAIDGAETVRRLLEFTRAAPGGEYQQSLDVRAAIQGVLAVAEPRWRDEAQAQGRVIEVVTEIADLPPMVGGAAELREVLLNLVFNAIDAMPNGGRLTLSAHLDGDTVRIAVADTGVGMSSEVAARIFEPFFTTKGPRRSGLGLSASYGIVQRHGGTLSVTTGENRGSVFTIVLPFRPPSSTEVAPPAPATNGHSLRVLVVDDDAIIRETLRSICESGGHRVVTASSASEAIGILGESPADVVCTDLGMPGMTGWQLADYVATEHPGVKVALVTGWSARLTQDLLNVHSVSALIAKPFRRDEVLSILSAMVP